MVKISVLMYVYNSESFLKDSLDSLINQSFNDMEIICINDKSSDKSLEILNKYRNRKNFSITSHNHLGYRSAVNNAMVKAKGKYLCIITPDCVLKEDAMKLWYDKAEESESDLTIANSEYFDEANNNRFKKNENFIKNFNPSKAFDYESIKDFIFDLDNSISNILFNRSFIKLNKICLPDSVSYGDEVFFYKSVLSAKKMYFIEDTLLTHRIYATSLAKRHDSQLLDNITVSNDIIEVFNKNNQLDNCKHIIYERKMNYMMDAYYKIQEECKEKYFLRLKQDLSDILDDEKMCKDFTENISPYNRKLFEQILISENVYEFELLRKTYYAMNEYYRLLDERRYLQPLATENDEEQ